MSDNPQDSDPAPVISPEIFGSQTSIQSASPSSSPPNGDGDGDDSREANTGDRKTDLINAGNETVPAIVAKDDGAGIVYLNTTSATFSYGIIEGEAIKTARWLAILNENVTEVQELSALEPKSIAAVYQYENYNWYNFEISLAGNYPNSLGMNMFVVLDGPSEFADFSLGVFSVVDDDSKVQELQDSLQAQAKNDKFLRPGFTLENAPWFMQGDNVTSSASGKVDLSSDGVPPSSTTGTGYDTGDMDKKPGLEGSDGGLTVAEKAGIGAGAGVAGLILIGLLIFFFLRRRRRRRAARSTDETSLTPANDFIRDKESHSARVAESPHSPASEDDRARDSAFTGGDAAERAPASPVPTTGTGSGQRDVPSAMAHLVEEGMSEADIRRLEEEERALDQAIEQAGRR